mmetsp:Transcript_2804/g.9395  ORF Transcript_2804/g.9395 Transcript_2804/m.9395 type:complete len:109 (+) Transcript_2804:188-514(+)
MALGDARSLWPVELVQAVAAISGSSALTMEVKKKLLDEGRELVATVDDLEKTTQDARLLKAKLLTLQKAMTTSLELFGSGEHGIKCIQECRESLTQELRCSFLLVARR